MDDFRELYLSTKSALTAEKEKRLLYETEAGVLKAKLADVESKMELARKTLETLAEQVNSGVPWDKEEEPTAPAAVKKKKGKSNV